MTARGEKELGSVPAELASVPKNEFMQQFPTKTVLTVTFF